MDRKPRLLTTEEMVTLIALGQYLLDCAAFPVRYVLGMEVPNG